MSLLSSIGMGFLLGLVAFFVLPLLAVALRDLLAGEHADRVPDLAGAWINFSMLLLRRGLLVLRESGDWSLKASRFDAALGRERTTLDGETMRWEDRAGLMARLMSVPFGMVHEGGEVVGDPRVAELASEIKTRSEQGAMEVEKRGDTWVCGMIGLPSPGRLVDVSGLKWATLGSASPRQTERTLDYTEKSQSIFNRKQAMEYVIWLMALGVGFGLMYLAAQTGTDGGGPGTVTSTLKGAFIYFPVAP